MTAPGTGIERNRVRRLRIAHVVAVYPPYWAGTGNVAHFNALELARRGHDVHVFTAQYPTEGYQDPLGFTVHRLWTPVRIGNAPLTPRLLTALRSFDLVHLHWPFMFGAELTWLAVRLWRVPYVMTYHIDLRAERRRVFGLYQQIWGPVLARRARRILAVSRDHLESSAIYPALAGRGDDIVELPNGVDTTGFHPGASGAEVRASYGIAPEQRVIAFVGALDKAHEYKGVPDLIAAFAQLDDPEAWLLLVGDGDLVPEYQALAARLPQRLQARVIFVGRVAHDQLPAYYAAADVEVLPSHNTESFGMVLIEALACGTPVVATDLPGPRSVIRNGLDGLLVQPRNVAGLADALQALLQDPTRREAMGQAGYRKVQTRYAWPRLAAQLEAVYNEVLFGA